MKIRIFILLIILLTNFQICFSQELLISILDSLAVNEKTIPTKAKKIEIDSIDCFELMKNKQSFYHSRLKDNIIYANSYKQYSIYLIISEDSFSEDKYKTHNPNLAHFYPKLAILFDRNKSICYILKYGETYWSPFFFYDFIDEYRTIKISTNFYKGINTIVQIDNNFHPICGLEMGALVMREEGGLRSIAEFSQCSDSTYTYNFTDIPENNIRNMTDKDLNVLFSIVKSTEKCRDNQNQKTEEKLGLFNVGISF